MQDRSALLLVSVNTFLALVAIVLILLKMNASKGTANYIISYRSSLGIDGFRLGTVWDISSFVVATGVILAFGLVLGYRTYRIKRELALTAMSLSGLLLVLLIIVSNALLFLR